MKKLYGVCDEDDGVIYTAYRTEEECGGLPHVELVENYTWEVSDWTDAKNGTNYIAVDRVAKAFRELCKSTKMKKQALAQICGKTPATFSRYCSGVCPVPRLVWDKVESLKR
jgi:hypothetical protein